MGDAAQGEPIQHEVFEKPFKVEPEFEEWDTPDNYRRFPGGDKLPDKMTVWRIQNTGKTYGGVVARSWGFKDSPDAEVLTPGFNRGKEYGAVGVGRHGNFLQWGYSAPPSKMTDAGKRFFLNCVCYIDKFDGKAPLIRRESSDRIDPIRLAMVMKQITDKEFGPRIFGEELFEKHNGDPDSLVKYFRDNYEYIYRDGVYRVDHELKALGIESNRTVRALGQLIALLENDGHAATARRLLRRYTTESFQAADEWQAWFDGNRDRLYFSDVGGYKFRVIPEGYLE